MICVQTRFSCDEFGNKKPETTKPLSFLLNENNGLALGKPFCSHLNICSAAAGSGATKVRCGICSPKTGVALVKGGKGTWWGVCLKTQDVENFNL